MNLLHPTLIPLALVMPGLSASPTTDTDGLFIAQHLRGSRLRVGVAGRR